MEDEKLKAEATAVALNAKITAQAKVIADSKTALEKLAIDFKDLKNLVTGDPDKKKAPVFMPAADFAKLSTVDKIRQRAMNAV
jgi:uncharacterized coiled-coil protein SlyX